MKFDMPKDSSSIIKVLGVGGGGSNAVNHMYSKGIAGVDFIICNTDSQDLEKSTVPNKVQLGSEVTNGLGAGANPEVGRECALASIEEINKVLENNTKMVFITAGMGGGTGTGGAPIVSQCAKDLGILTVGIVTSPFAWEGKRKIAKALEGIEQLKEHVDTLLVINNDKLREIFGNLSMSDAFAHADDILTNAAKGIAEIITVSGYVNVDFKDVETVMKDGGLAVMGSSTARGEDRAIQAIEKALNSPLLDDNNIVGAKNILINISYGDQEVLLDEITEITDYVQEEAGKDVDDIIWGACYNESLTDELSVIVVATGFPKNGLPSAGVLKGVEPGKKVFELEDKLIEKTVPVNIQKEETKPSLFPEASDESKSEEIVFDLTNKNAQKNNLEEKTEHIEELPKINIVEKPENITDESKEMNELDEIQKIKNDERQNMLKQLSVKIKSPRYISEIENEPAYKRKNIELDINEGLSSGEEMSRYTLSDPEEGERPEIRPNNPFLHDNVD
jgi:cell division protein FtsZ